MRYVLQFIKDLTTPPNLTEKDGLSYWQDKIMRTLLLIAVILGLPAYLAGVTVMIKDKIWYMLFFDTAIYGLLVYLFINRTLSYRTKAFCLLVMNYTLGTILSLIFGPFGEGPVWLFFFPMLAGILLGFRASVACLSINALTILALAIRLYYPPGHLPIDIDTQTWDVFRSKLLENWPAIGLNFMLLNVIASLSVTTILEGFQKSIQSLAASENRYRNIFENIQDVYFETRLDGTLIEISPSIKRVSHYSPEELRGMSLLTLYKDLEQRDQTVQRIITEGSITNHEVTFLDKDNSEVTCSINARLTRDKNNLPAGTVGIFRDITIEKAVEREKNTLEEQLIRAKKMEALGLLAGGVAHDLNNILSGVVTYPELLAMDLDPDDPMRKTLDMIHDSGKRAAEIVQDLLTLSRRGVIVQQKLDLNHVVTDFLATPEYKKIISFHPGIEVKTQIDAPTPFLKGSNVHLQKSLMNLFINAAESQPDGGKIIIRTQNLHLDQPITGYEKVETGTYVLLSVEDKGTGISKEDLKRIFEPFFTKKIMGRSGTGLGMAVVWGTVQDHNGYIDIISKENKGTTFNLYFPVCQEETDSMNDHFEINDYMGNGQTIIIVDDMGDQRQIAASALKRLGYRPIALDCGMAAINYLKLRHADLLLIDMIMPEMDGLETYRRILEFKPDTKALIASGYSQTPAVDQALKLGAGGYLKKPFTIEKIGLAVKNVLAG